MVNSAKPDRLTHLSWQQQLPPLSAFFHFTGKMQTDSLTVDKLIQYTWSRCLAKNDYALNASLYAIGGYGRGMLCPYSDIDILILIDEDLEKTLSESIISDFITRLWDCHLKLSHQVHTIADCHEKANQDLSFYTSLLEARLLVSANKPIKLNIENTTWTASRFFEAKQKEQHERHLKYGSVNYQQQPHVKNSPGGLRDIQMIQWIQLAFPHCMLLTPAEQDKLSTAERLLHQLRYALHIISRKAAEVLRWDQQLAIAEAIKPSILPPLPAHLLVERFMKTVFQQMRQVKQLNQMVMQKIPDENQHERAIEKKNFFTPILEFTQSGQPIPREVIRHITSASINYNSPAAYQNLLSLLKLGKSAIPTIRWLALYGILGKMIPAFAKIEGLVQLDLFHVYTVDQHTLAIVERTLEMPIDKNKLNIVIAALFHDLGKGHHGDHSQIGISFAKKFATQCGLSTKDIDMITWLVEHHLLMSTTAQRQDIADPNVIQRFANIVNTHEKLTALHYLTIADIQATNPSIWNSWKQSLLSRLDERTTHLLASHDLGLPSPEAHTEQLGQTLADNLPIVMIQPHPTLCATNIHILSPLGQRAFSVITDSLEKMKLTIVAAHLAMTRSGYNVDTYTVLQYNSQPLENHHHIARLKQHLEKRLEKFEQRPMTPARFTPQKSSGIRLLREPLLTIHFSTDLDKHRTILFLITIDRPGLLASIATAFIQTNVQLIEAKIVTLAERVEDTFFINTENNEPLSEAQQYQLTLILKEQLLT